MDDGHSTSCTYQACSNPNAELPCPFVKDSVTGVETESHEVSCNHEWRQLWHLAGEANINVAAYGRPMPEGFFCVYCLERTKK